MQKKVTLFNASPTTEYSVQRVLSCSLVGPESFFGIISTGETDNLNVVYEYSVHSTKHQLVTLYKLV